MPMAMNSSRIIGRRIQLRDLLTGCDAAFEKALELIRMSKSFSRSCYYRSLGLLQSQIILSNQEGVVWR
jgi:hypothetical protein